MTTTSNNTTPLGMDPISSSTPAGDSDNEDIMAPQHDDFSHDNNGTTETIVPLRIAVLDANPLTCRLFDSAIDDCFSEPWNVEENENEVCERIDSITLRNNCADDFGLEARQTVVGALRESRREVKLEYLWASMGMLKMAMCRNDVVVVGAHGALQTHSPAFLAFENDRGAAEAIYPRHVTEILGKNEGPFQSQIVILGACHSQEMGIEIAKLPGVRYVIATKRGQEVQTRVCEALVASLLRDLLAGITMPQAFANAIVEISSLQCLADDASRERQKLKFMLIPGQHYEMLKLPRALGHLHDTPTESRSCLKHVNRKPGIVARDAVLRGVVGYLTHPVVTTVMIQISQAGLGTSRVIAAACDFLMERDRIDDLYVISSTGKCTLDSPRPCRDGKEQQQQFFDQSTFDLYVADFPATDMSVALSAMAGKRGKLLLVVKKEEEAPPVSLSGMQAVTAVVPLPPLHDEQAASFLQKMGFDKLGADLYGVMRQGRGNPKLLMEAAKAMMSNRTLPRFMDDRSSASTLDESLFTRYEGNMNGGGGGGGGAGLGAIKDVSPITKLVYAISSTPGVMVPHAKWKNFVNALHLVFIAHVYEGISRQNRLVRTLSEEDLLFVRRKLIHTASAPPAGGGSDDFDIVSPDTVRLVWRAWLAPTIRTLHQVERYWSHNIIHGFAAREEVEARLSCLGPGAFVIRTSDSMPGSLAVSYVLETNEIRHVLIAVLSADGRVAIQFKKENRMYNSLSAFVLESTKLTDVVVGCHDAGGFQLVRKGNVF